MLVEADILGGHGGVHKVLRQLVVVGVGAVLDMEGGEDFTVLGKHLGGKLIVRMFQLLERGYLGEDAHQNQQEQHQGERRYEDDPEPFDYCAFCFVCHFFRLKTQNYY